MPPPLATPATQPGSDADANDTIADELEALTAIFGNVTVAPSLNGDGESDNPSQPSMPCAQRWTIKVSNDDTRPQTFTVTLPPGYPHTPAVDFAISPAPPESDESVCTVLANRAAEAAAVGEPVIFELIQLAQSHHELDKEPPPAGTDAATALSPILPAVDASGDAPEVSVVLPTELWVVIFALLSRRDTLWPSLVCKRWRAIIQDDPRWREWFDDWLLRWPGRTAYRPRPRHRALFTFHALVKAQPRLLAITTLARAVGTPGAGGSRSVGARRRTQVVRLTTVTDASRCQLQHYCYGPSSRPPTQSAVVWLSHPIDLHRDASSIRRLLLLPDNTIAVSDPAIPELFTVAPSSAQWAEVDETIYLPLRAPAK
jgi:hypothetical protein